MMVKWFGMYLKTAEEARRTKKANIVTRREAY